MPNDDEIVSEGTEQPSWAGLETVHVETFSDVDGQIVVEGQSAQVSFERGVDDFEFGQASMSEIAAINSPTPTEPTPTDGLPPNLQTIYPRLSIVEEADPQHPEQGTGDIDFDFFVYLTAFQESFNARWTQAKRSYGRLNPMYYYGGTSRTAEISFTLPAGTVRESRNNLNNCSQLSRAVYGRYKKWNEGKDFTLLGHRYFRIDFGSLIRNERAFISSFSFTTNQDAGVFDHSAEDDTDVTHEATGVVLPRQVDVKISIIFKHDYPLGFSGPYRATFDRTKWAPNNSKDFPHGTGNHPLQPYMIGDGNIPVSRTSRTGADERHASIIAEYNRRIQHLQEQLAELRSIDSNDAITENIAQLEAQIAALVSGRDASVPQYAADVNVPEANEE